jgi:hypothetical protein
VQAKYLGTDGLGRHSGRMHDMQDGIMQARQFFDHLTFSPIASILRRFCFAKSYSMMCEKASFDTQANKWLCSAPLTLRILCQGGCQNGKLSHVSTGRTVRSRWIDGSHFPNARKSSMFGKLKRSNASTFAVTSSVTAEYSPLEPTTEGHADAH